MYAIRLKKGNRRLIPILRNGLIRARNRNKKRKSAGQTFHDYPDARATHTDTDTIYVGRSKTPIDRFTRHLGRKRGKTQTRGLYMQTWATKLDEQAEIVISYMYFDDLENDVVQAIEDGLWRDMRPAFGKKGPR